jgi:hypothetical protein
VSITIGAGYYSRTRFHAEDESSPRGGIAYWADHIGEGDTGEIVEMVHLVEVWQGRVQYSILPASDLENGLSGGLVNTRSLKSVLLALGRDEERLRDPLKHHSAKTMLAHVLTQLTPTPRRGR